jgi:thiol-disulfide isomerase/thioredoxin
LEDISSVDAFKNKVAKGTSMVFYSAIWCEVCEDFRPTVELVSTNPDLSAFNFIEIEYDDNRDIFNEYSVNSFPTVLLF